VQAVHGVAELLPAAHLVQAAAPVAEYCPSGQLEQVTVESPPEEAVNNPTLHAVQALDDTRAVAAPPPILPAGHAVQVTVPVVAEKYPSAQATHALSAGEAPVSGIWPAAHDEH